MLALALGLVSATAAQPAPAPAPAPAGAISGALVQGGVATLSGKLEVYEEDGKVAAVLAVPDAELRTVYLMLANAPDFGPEFPAGWGWDAEATVEALMWVWVLGREAGRRPSHAACACLVYGTR